MNVERVICEICRNGAFHIFKMTDNGLYVNSEYICTNCGAHYSTIEITQEYSALWNEFIAKMDTSDNIESVNR